MKGNMVFAGRTTWAVTALLVVAITSWAAAPPAERGDGVVAADEAQASQAGAEVLARGGNAFDAAVAAALAAGVVQPAGSGLGGGGFAVWVDGSDRGSVDFREEAPSRATRDMYRTPDGGVDPQASRVGGLAVAVPAEGKGLARLLAERGRLTPAQDAAPAIALAKRGFRLGHYLHETLEQTKYGAVQTLFTHGGPVPHPGAVIRRPDLARTLQRWAATAGQFLYAGDGAREVARAVDAAGGVMTAEDLAAYAAMDRDPIVVHYEGYTVISMAPPSSGGVCLGEMLRVLEGYDLVSLGLNSSDYVHLLTEVMKHAYADRAHYLGDPDFVKVPVKRLLSDERRDAIRKKVWPGRTFDAKWYGSLIRPPQDAGTQHISVVDGKGAAVALTTTVNTAFGSGVVVPELGLLLNNEMDDFAAAPGVPNVYGLVGDEANAIQPGKRPLSSMTPTVVLDPDGHIVMAIGASGGSFIISSVLQVMLDVLEFHMDPQQAVATPRFHDQWMPEKLFLEPGFPADVVRALKARGHHVEVKPGFSSVQVVVRDGKAWAGVADPRKGGWPAGVWRD